MSAETSRPASAEQLLTIIRERRTTHDFKPDAHPPRDLILRALEAAIWAPNHHQTEPWRFYIIGEETKAAIIERNTELLTKTKSAEIAEHKRRRWSEIPGWLVVTSAISEDPLITKENYAATACAIQNILLMLAAKGVATKWSTGPITRDEAFYDICWIDSELEEVVGLVWYGYSDGEEQVGRDPLTHKLVEMP